MKAQDQYRREEEQKRKEEKAAAVLFAEQAAAERAAAERAAAAEEARVQATIEAAVAKKAAAEAAAADATSEAEAAAAAAEAAAATAALEEANRAAAEAESRQKEADAAAAAQAQAEVKAQAEAKAAIAAAEAAAAAAKAKAEADIRAQEEAQAQAQSESQAKFQAELRARKQEQEQARVRAKALQASAAVESATVDMPPPEVPELKMPPSETQDNSGSLLSLRSERSEKSTPRSPRKPAVVPPLFGGKASNKPKPAFRRDSVDVDKYLEATDSSRVRMIDEIDQPDPPPTPKPERSSTLSHTQNKKVPGDSRRSQQEVRGSQSRVGEKDVSRISASKKSEHKDPPKNTIAKQNSDTQSKSSRKDKSELNSSKEESNVRIPPNTQSDSSSLNSSEADQTAVCLDHPPDQEENKQQQTSPAKVESEALENNEQRQSSVQKLADPKLIEESPGRELTEVHQPQQTQQQPSNEQPLHHDQSSSQQASFENNPEEVALPLDDSQDISASTNSHQQDPLPVRDNSHSSQNIEPPQHTQHSQSDNTRHTQQTDHTQHTEKLAQCSDRSPYSHRSTHSQEAPKPQIPPLHKDSLADRPQSHRSLLREQHASAPGHVPVVVHPQELNQNSANQFFPTDQHHSGRFPHQDQSIHRGSLSRPQTASSSRPQTAQSSRPQTAQSNRPQTASSQHSQVNSFRSQENSRSPQMHFSPPHSQRQSNSPHNHQTTTWGRQLATSTSAPALQFRPRSGAARPQSPIANRSYSPVSAGKRLSLADGASTSFGPISYRSNGMPSGRSVFSGSMTNRSVTSVDEDYMLPSSRLPRRDLRGPSIIVRGERKERKAVTKARDEEFSYGGVIKAAEAKGCDRAAVQARVELALQKQRKGKSIDQKLRDASHMVNRAKRASKMQISFEDKAFTTNRGRKAFKTSAFLKDRKKHMLQLLMKNDQTLKTPKIPLDPTLSGPGPIPAGVIKSQKRPLTR